MKLGKNRYSTLKSAKKAAIARGVGKARRKLSNGIFRRKDGTYGTDT